MGRGWESDGLRYSHYATCRPWRSLIRYELIVDITCPKCDRAFHIDQKYPYHAGFGNEGFLYCEECPNLVVFGSYDPRYTTIVGKVHPWMLSDAEKEKVQEQLKACPCGGHFRFTAKPRCPLCNQVVPSILPDYIHYIETGKRLDGDKESIWKP